MMWFGSLFMVFFVPGIQSEVSHAFLHGNEGVPRQFLYLPNQNGPGFPQVGDGSTQSQSGFPQILEGDRGFPHPNLERFPQILQNQGSHQTSPDGFPQIHQDQGSPQTSPKILQGLPLIHLQGQLGSQNFENGPNTQTRFTTRHLNRDLGHNYLDVQVLTVTVTQTIYSLTTTTRISTIAIPSTTTDFLASTSTDFFRKLETTPANLKLATHERTTTFTQLLSVTDTLGITTITTSFVPTITSVPVDETIVKTSIVYSTIVNTKIFSHTITTTTILDPTGPATEYTTVTRTVFKHYQPYNSLPVYRRNQ